MADGKTTLKEPPPQPDERDKAIIWDLVKKAAETAWRSMTRKDKPKC